MDFKNSVAEIYYPAEQNLDGVTDMCIAAHQDDVEIMAYAPIAACFDNEERNFFAVVVADGAGSPREGEFAHFTDEQMKTERISEQRRAADIGKYRAVAQLGYSSSNIKNAAVTDTVEDIYNLLMSAKPRYLYTHNIADKHDTHVAVALRVLEAVKKMPEDMRPEKIVGLEVWRGLDWLCDGDKICLDTGFNPELARELLAVHRSQVAGGKRYDNAAMGRRFANATFFASHSTDNFESMSIGVDLMPIVSGGISPKEYIASYIRRFEDEINSTLERLG